MVYHLTFEDMNQLLKHQIMNPSHEISHPTPTSLNHVLPTTHLNISTRPSSALSENNILMQCMQKLAGQTYSPAPTTVDPRLILQESNGQIMSTSSTKGEGGLDDQHGGGAGTGCTPRPRWCPTPEQIQVLEALFNSGTTTPSRDMIVEIAGCLKQFGNIVEANVFYWFQNRKARAKRKLRMQVQLQQQASTSPTHSNDCSSSQNGKSSATSRRVCAKTARKTSPGADHYQLPPALVHLPTAAHHSDQYHPNLLASAHGGLVSMPPRSALQVINNASSCKMMNSSNADQHPSCALSNSCPSQTHDKHAQNHVISITSEPPPAFSDQLECTDHHCNTGQHHIECDPYNNHMSCLNAENAHLPPIASVASSSPPGSTGSSDAMVGSSCSPAIAQESAANVPRIFQTPHAISTFLASSTDQARYTMPAADSYSNLALTTGSSNGYHVDKSVGSLSLPSKRSWMDALMQEFVATGRPTHINNTSTSTPSNIMHNVYDMNYQTKAQTNEDLNIINHYQNHTPIDLNLLLQRPQINPRQGSLTASSLTNFSRLDSNMVPASQLNFVIREDNRSANITTLCREQHLQTSSPSQAFHPELHGEDYKGSRDPEDLESLMSSTSTTSQIQQQNNMAFATSSPKVNHHCDNLPLWEALAPYMSIGS